MKIGIYNLVDSSLQFFIGKGSNGVGDVYFIHSIHKIVQVLIKEDAKILLINRSLIHTVNNKKLLNKCSCDVCSEFFSKQKILSNLIDMNEIISNDEMLFECSTCE